MSATVGAEDTDPVRPGDLLAERITVNQIVAWNMAYFRKASGMTQEDLGARIGWSKAIVSAAERSWDGARVRQFTADDVVSLAVGLRVPVVALFLPPDDDGERVSYSAAVAGADLSMGDLMELVVMPDTTDDSSLINIYRQRFNRAGHRAASSSSPAWGRLITRWTSGNPGIREAAAKELRAAAVHEELAANRLTALANAIAPDPADAPTAKDADD